MTRIENVIEDYLKIETNYAILLTGAWGSGKSYYLKNNLSSLIKRTDLYIDASQKYEPVVISLYGIKSIDDLQTEILISLKPYLKGLQLAYGIAKFFLKGALALKSLGSLDDAIEGVEKTIKPAKIINFSKFVLCLDDLERISDSLKLEELIGFINGLVESSNIKVILVADSDKITDDKFAVLKEKTIGNTIEFYQDLKTATTEIINARFAGDKEYSKFLNQNINLIIDFFKPHSGNLRMIEYALICYKKVFYEIELNLKAEKILKEKYSEILIDTLKYTIAISIEYKSGSISFSKKEGLDMNKITLDDISLDSLFASNKLSKEKESEKTYREIFLEKYFKGVKYNYYDSLYNYITGGDKFRIIDLKSEIEASYHIINKIIPVQYKCYEDLSYYSCYSLSNSEYKSKTLEMLKYADKGLYNLIDYITIFHYCIRLGNPFKFNLDRLTKRLIKGIKFKKSDNELLYDGTLNFRIVWTKGDPYEHYYKQIKLACVEVNENIKLTSESTISNHLEDLFYNDYNKFYEEITDSKSKRFNSALFDSFNFKRFYSFLINSSNNEKFIFLNILKVRYPDDYNTQGLKKELKFLDQLKLKFQKKCKTIKNQNVTGYLYHEILNNLIKAIENVTKDDIN